MLLTVRFVGTTLPATTITIRLRTGTRTTGGAALLEKVILRLLWLRLH